MTTGQRKPEGQWTVDERKAANLDQQLKSLIMSVLPDDQMNSIINCLTAKSTWDDLILYHEGPSDVKESRVMDLKLPKKWLCFCQSLRNTNHVKDSELASLFGKLKYEEKLIDSISETKKKKSLVSATLLSTAFFSTSIFKPKLRPTKDFESKYNKVKAKLALLCSNASASKSSMIKNKGLIDEAYEWDEEEVSSDDNETTKLKAFMALADDENLVVDKESSRNVECSIRKVHILFSMEDNDERKYFLDYLCMDLNYVEEHRNNLVIKHRNLVQELKTCKERLLVLKQAKLDFYTMQHVNTEILKENKNLRIELKELTEITETWLISSNKVNQYISEQFLIQKKNILGVDQITEDPSSSGQKDLVSEKSSANDTKVSIPGVEKHMLSEAEVAVTDSSTTDYDSMDESLVCSTPLPSMKKLDGVEPVSGQKTIKSILKSKSTFKVEALKGVIIN
ncbi:hypothetical protein Tco_0524633 [Tanacetum coccineum]